jgi:rubredoxin
MSEEIAQKKKDEIEFLEKQDTSDKERIQGDMCPVCGMRPTSYPYIQFLPSPFGWLECASCGTIYAPKSIRDQKIDATKHSVAKPISIVEGV